MLLAQSNLLVAALQAGAVAEQSLDREDGRWGSVGLVWKMDGHLDAAGRLKLASHIVPLFVGDFTCVRSGGRREYTGALTAEVAWWSGRGNGLHAMVAPGAALQHMPAARSLGVPEHATPLARNASGVDFSNSWGGDRTLDLTIMSRALSPAELPSHEAL